MKNKEHPAAILRVAWNVHRLDAIRGIVDETIHALQASDPRIVPGREPSACEQQPDRGPVREALLTCCDELREACGLSRAGGALSAESERLAGQAEAWLESYQSALERYRCAAAAALRAKLDAAAGVSSTAPDDPPSAG